MTVAENQTETVEVFTKAKFKHVKIPAGLTVAEDVVSLDNKQFGIFRIMTAKDGDKRLIWNRFSIPEIEDAKKMFLQLVQEGMVPYKVGINGRASSEVMDEFDPFAEEVLFLPIQAISGG